MKTFLFVALLALNCLRSHAADILTLTGTQSYVVGSNDVAEVIAASFNGDQFSQGFYLNGAPVFITQTARGTGPGIVSLLPIAITGPSNTITTTTGGGFVTLRIRTKAEYLSTFAQPSPAISSSVVIPEDASGPVNIVIESSTDLVTWVAANPGSYGATTTRRFFRVRAVAN